jgi:hypothetical protein
MENRKEELRQQRERELRQVARRERNAIFSSPTANQGLEEEAYTPTPEQKASLETLGASVASLLSVPADQLLTEATVTCVRDQTDTHRLQPYERGVSSGMAAEVSVEDGTASLQFSLAQATHPAIMDAGEVVTFPISQPSRTPSCDWRIVLSYRAAPPPSSKSRCRARA